MRHCTLILVIINCIFVSTTFAMEKGKELPVAGDETLDRKMVIALVKDLLGSEIINLCSISDEDAKKCPDIPVDICGVFQQIINSKRPHLYRYFFDHVSVYARDEVWKYTALHGAVLLKLWEEAHLLLKRGANPDARDYLGFSVLARALEQDAPKEIIAALLQGGASLTTRLKAGASLAWVASRVKDAETRRIIYAAIIKHQEEKFENVIDHRNEKFVPDFECPVCNKKAYDPFEFINEKCGHVVCAPCKAKFKTMCPWCPAQKLQILI